MKASPAARQLVRLIGHTTVGAALAVSGLAAGCGEPSRLPDVLPLTPSPDTFALAGTVTETAPTTSTTVPHAQLTLDGINNGISTTADENGRFSFGQVKGGRFNLFAARDGYGTGTYPIELKRDSDYAIRIPPEFKEVTEIFRGTLDWNVPPCRPVEYSCSDSYSFELHYNGKLLVELAWTGSAELVMTLDGWDTLSSNTAISVNAGRRYVVDVVYKKGTGPVQYTLVMTHPN